MEDLLSVMDAAEELEDILSAGERFKAARRGEGRNHPLRGKTLAMIFEKASTRSRISFEVGMAHLGGRPCTSAGRTFSWDAARPWRIPRVC